MEEQAFIQGNTGKLGVIEIKLMYIRHIFILIKKSQDKASFYCTMLPHEKKCSEQFLKSQKPTKVSDYTKVGF